VLPRKIEFFRQQGKDIFRLSDIFKNSSDFLIKKIFHTFLINEKMKNLKNFLERAERIS